MLYYQISNAYINKVFSNNNWPQFHQITLLSHLHVSKCNENSLSGETFANVSAVTSHDLSYNYTRTLDINILKALPKLSTLYLYDNPLQCDCQLQEVWRWCEDRNIQTAGRGLVPDCDTPSEVKRMGWGVRHRAVIFSTLGTTEIQVKIQLILRTRFSSTNMIMETIIMMRISSSTKDQ